MRLACPLAACLPACLPAWASPLSSLPAGVRLQSPCQPTLSSSVCSICLKVLPIQAPLCPSPPSPKPPRPGATPAPSALPRLPQEAGPQGGLLPVHLVQLLPAQRRHPGPLHPLLLLPPGAGGHLQGHLLHAGGGGGAAGLPAGAGPVLPHLLCAAAQRDHPRRGATLLSSSSCGCGMRQAGQYRAETRQRCQFITLQLYIIGGKPLHYLNILTASQCPMYGKQTENKTTQCVQQTARAQQCCQSTAMLLGREPARRINPQTRHPATDSL